MVQIVKRLKLIYRNLLIILNMKGINYNNLRELTVFDICDNPSLLKEIAIDKTKEAHMKRCIEIAKAVKDGSGIHAIQQR